MRLIAELVSPTGKRKLRLYERVDGLFRFKEFYEDYDEHAGFYWTPGYQSGLFDTQAAAEADMQAMTPWLRPMV